MRMQVFKVFGHKKELDKLKFDVMIAPHQKLRNQQSYYNNPEGNMDVFQISWLSVQ